MLLKFFIQAIYSTATLVENKSKRRDKLVIMTDIIFICRTGSTKTNIMFKGNVFRQLNEYIYYLLYSGLLEKKGIGRKGSLRGYTKRFGVYEKTEANNKRLSESVQTIGVKSCLW